MQNTTTPRVQYVGETTVIPTGDQHAAERARRLTERHAGIAEMGRAGWRLTTTVQIPAEATITIDDLFERIIPD